jgi:hypothetical protein
MSTGVFFAGGLCLALGAYMLGGVAGVCVAVGGLACSLALVGEAVNMVVKRGLK